MKCNEIFGCGGLQPSERTLNFVLFRAIPEPAKANNVGSKSFERFLWPRQASAARPFTQVRRLVPKGNVISYRPSYASCMKTLEMMRDLTPARTTEPRGKASMETLCIGVPSVDNALGRARRRPGIAPSTSGSTGPPFELNSGSGHNCTVFGAYTGHPIIWSKCCSQRSLPWTSTKDRLRYPCSKA
jgi:hypothetical protein